ncbi:hypothetical protein [Puerhibacterium puerhi]|uniref:hypothetical protein n=1 Tax=Puerhibacterium puerhi TaxID=2692623 RepID=UPI00135B8BCF|nr:hypothetical protein [Puerhibacterium puerhi]
MTEYRLVTFAFPASQLLPPVGTVNVRTIDFAGSIPELAEHMDGWEVINTQLIPGGDVIYVTYSLRTNVAVPGGTQAV